MKQKVFSASEETVIEIIGRKKKTIAQITKEYFGDPTELMDPNNYIAAVVRRVARKCDFHSLPWTLEGAGRGRRGRTVWRAPRGH